MTIEIHRRELEALILDRMKRGAFHDVEDVLMQALTSSAPPPEEQEARTGADLIAAMQASPHRELPIDPERFPLPVRDVVF